MKGIIIYLLLSISFASFAQTGGPYTKEQLHLNVKNNIRPGLTPFKVGNLFDSLIESINNGTPVGSITGLGTGVSTWLATPSWTNFNSAITGTAPYWSLNGSGTQGSSGTSITQATATSGSPTGFTYIGAPHTTLNSGEVTDWFLDLSRVVNLNGGNFSLNRSGRTVGPTFTATSSTTINNAYTWEFVAPISSTNVNFSTKGLSGGSFAVSAVGGMVVSYPSFTGRGFLYQSANNTTRIGGGPAGENISFGPNNAITASNTMFGSGGFIASSIAGTNNNAFTSTYSLAQTSGTLSPYIFRYSPSSAVSTSGSYSGTQHGYSYDDDIFAMTSTVGLNQIPYRAKARMIAASGTTNYTAFLADPVINNTSTHAGGLFTALLVNPTKTAIVGTTLRGIVIPDAAFQSGLGTSSPTATLDIDGTFRLRTGGTLDYVMKSDANGNATWQEDGSNFTASVKKFDTKVINIQTTSGNTDLALFTGLTDATIQVKINVVAIKSDGSEAYACEKTATFKKDGAATPVQVGTTTTLSEHIDDLVENPFTGIAMNSTNIRFTYSAGLTSVDNYRWTIFAEITQNTY